MNFIDIYGVSLHYETMRQKKLLKELKNEFECVYNAPNLEILGAEKEKALIKLSLLRDYCKIDIEKALSLVDVLMEIYINRKYDFLS